MYYISKKNFETGDYFFVTVSCHC